ncbi:glycosyltransferase family 2 protein [Methanolobus halotolerans]|uniref:Glycosyl transferase family 2 n=1 Tax=Methanolobus halotolerans TaxID=2052935 RepID=A0A4E0PYL1_9EURY|nr:glycosyltransferase [Methanolobus halotolerans]TGC10610.1 glycosyl transferase family 2 [Methanolobus halotolerans]
MTPEISVIMASYNSEKYLSESIQSILDQTFEEFEFLIINDCSTDNSLHIIDEHAKQDDRIFLIDNKANLGLTKSLNLGLKEAKGKYIARIDSDDIALPERLRIQYDFLEQNRDVFLVGSGAYTIDENGSIRTKIKPSTEVKDIKKKLSVQNCLSHPTIMFRNEGFMYREKFVYAQDYDFYLILLSNNKKIANIFEPLIKYRINPDAISWSKKSKQNYFALTANEFYHKRLKYGKDEYAKFDPNKILSIDVKNSTNEFVLKSEIEVKFKLNEFGEVRELCKKFFWLYGFDNELLIYYLLSFTGKNFINAMRNILFN